LDAAALGPLTHRVRDGLDEITAQDVVARVWRGDYTLWSDDPAEITQPSRLGWLDVASSMERELEGLRRFADEVTAQGYTRAVLCGMGGSSLAAEVFQRMLGRRPGAVRLDVLDSTHPDVVLPLVRGLEPGRTLFLISSKSGTTVETRSHLDYLWDSSPEGRHYVAITDEGTPLHRAGLERGFRRVFVNRPDIGGRYSALSYFGLVPGALIGADLRALLDSARKMAAACRDGDARENPGAFLGAVLGEAALAGRDKLTLFLPDDMAPFGDWVEQLIAESTGKQGKGILPIVGEPPGPPDAYGEDRLFVAFGFRDEVRALQAAGQPVVTLPLASPDGLGAEMFRWEFATAVAAQRLRINPFDQPDVQAAKDATARILEAGAAGPPETAGIEALLADAKPGEYVALLAFLPRTEEVEASLQALRQRLARRCRLPVTVGFGPRYQHSSGQLHKGGPPTGRFIVITDEPSEDAPIPGRPYSWAGLLRAQALGEVETLLALGRPVALVQLGRDRLAALDRLRARAAWEEGEAT